MAAGCRKDIPQLNRPEDYYISGSFTGTFEMFWSGMNHNYVFWEIEYCESGLRGVVGENEWTEKMR